jgi:hypothetical protein
MLVGLTFGCAAPGRSDVAVPINKQNCDLQAPPDGAGSNYVHGTYLFIYPRALPSAYTGCQIAWAEDGQKWMMLLIEDGHTKREWVTYPSGLSGVKYVCIYENDSLVNVEERFCEPYQKETPFGDLLFKSVDVGADPVALRKLKELQQRAAAR